MDQFTTDDGVMTKRRLLLAMLMTLLGTSAESQGVRLQVYNDWSENQGVKFSTGGISGWKGQDFTTGSHPTGYTLDRIEWRFKDAETGDQVDLWYVPLGSGDQIGRQTAGREPMATLVHQEVSNTEPAESDRPAGRGDATQRLPADAAPRPGGRHASGARRRHQLLILDRILHHATTISIRGDSYRLKDKLKSGVVKPTTAGT